MDEDEEWMRYNRDCRGDPWPGGLPRPDKLDCALSWKRQATQLGHWKNQPFIVPAFNVANTVMAFLRRRHGPDGEPMANSVKEISVYDDNWVRFAIEPSDVVEDFWQRFDVTKNCDRAFQAVRFGCLYSILFSRHLLQTVNNKGKSGIRVYTEKDT